MTKKGIVIFATSAVLAATLAVGGTLAYFSNKAKVTNTFTVGNVAMAIDETKVVKNGNDFTTPDKNDKVTANTYEAIYPGAELPKDPTITVKANSEDSYVGMKVTVDTYATMTDDDKAIFDDMFTAMNDANGWKCISNANGVYTLAYELKQVKSENDTKIAPAFTEIKIPATLNNGDMTALNNFNMNVEGGAIQAQGLANADAAITELFK